MFHFEQFSQNIDIAKIKEAADDHHH
jgi:hypothetical protein